MLKSVLIVVTLGAAAPAAAQAVDPGVVAQALVLRGTAEGYADRDRARRRGHAARPAVSDRCMAAWRMRDRMSREQRRRLYDACPR